MTPTRFKCQVISVGILLFISFLLGRKGGGGQPWTNGCREQLGPAKHEMLRQGIDTGLSIAGSSEWGN